MLVWYGIFCGKKNISLAYGWEEYCHFTVVVEKMGGEPYGVVLLKGGFCDASFKAFYHFFWLMQHRTL